MDFLTAFLAAMIIATPINDPEFVDLLSEKDSVVVFHTESRKPAKVAIFNSVVRTTVYGPDPPTHFTLSFLHFPDCRQMVVGHTYIGVIRHQLGSSYSLVRSDMLSGWDDDRLRNFFWPSDSAEARQLIESVSSPN